MEQTTKVTPEEMVEHINGLNTFMKLRLYGMLEQEKEEAEKLKPIRDYFEDKRRSYYLDEIYSIGEEIHIVKLQVKNGKEEEETRYMPFLNFKTTHSYGRSVEEAMLIALAYKFDGAHSHSVPYIARMLNMPTFD